MYCDRGNIAHIGQLAPYDSQSGLLESPELLTFSHLVDNTTQCVPTPSRNVKTWALFLTMPCPFSSLSLFLPCAYISAKQAW